MVTFKKDKDKKDNKYKELLGYLSIFLCGFIIATFLVLYLVLHIVGNLTKNNQEDTSSSESSSSEVISSSSESSSSSSSSEYNYLNEEDIYNNLLDIAKDSEPNIYKINSISYDDTYLYIDALEEGDEYLDILYGELGEYTVDELLEALISSKDIFSLDYIYSTYSLTNEVTTDITTLDSFPKRDYIIKNKYLYYIDTDSKVIGLSAVGYKANSYLSFSHYQYNIDTLSYNEGFLKETSKSNSEFYKVLSYLYNK